jgi:hypothetical protein
MDDQGRIRDLAPNEPLRSNEIDVTSVVGALGSMGKPARKAYWRAIRRGAGEKRAMERALAVQAAGKGGGK